MSNRKWGESFLKSGLPLEHIAAVTLRSMDWTVESNLEYKREPDVEKAPWFEVDMLATGPKKH